MSIGRFTIDGNGTVHVKNESAYWIPEMTVMEVIHGTTYIVTGSYEGTESIYRNLERIMESENFRSFSLDWYDNERVINAIGMTERAYMERVLEICIDLLGFEAPEKTDEETEG